MRQNRTTISRLKAAVTFLLAFGSTPAIAQTPMSPAQLLQQNNSTIVNGVIPSQLNSLLGNMIVSASATFNVVGYGAACNAVKSGSTWTGTDDTTAFQKAITAASAGPIAGGSTAIIQVPAANCLLTGSPAITASGVRIVGQGPAASNLVFQNTSNDGLLFAGVYSPYTAITGDGLYDITLTGSGKTGGNLLNLEAVFQFRSEDVVLNNIWNGLLVSNGSNDVKFDNLVIQAVTNGNPTVGSYGIRLSSPPPTTSSFPTTGVEVISFSNSTVNTVGVNSHGMDCMDVDGWVGTIRFDQTNLLNCHFGARFYNPTGNTVGAIPSFIQANDLETDGTVYGVSIESGIHYNFTNSIFDATAGTASTYPFQILLDTAAVAFPYGITMSGGKIFNAPGGDAYINGNDAAFTGVHFVSSNSGTTTKPVVELGPHARNVNITGGKIGTETDDTYGGTYSVTIDNGATGTLLNGVDMSENLAGITTGQLGTIHNLAGAGNVNVIGGMDYLGHQIGPTVSDAGINGIKQAALPNNGTSSSTSACYEVNTSSANAYGLFCETDGAQPTMIVSAGTANNGGVGVSPYMQLVGQYSAAGTPLPSCIAGLKGVIALVIDATAPTYRGAYTSGGTVTTLAECNGSTWEMH